MNQILELVSLLIALSSFGVWVHIGARLAQHQPLISGPVPVTRPRNLAVIVLAGLWIASALWTEWKSTEAPPAPLQINLDQAAEGILMNVVFQVFVAAVFLLALSEVNQRGLNRYGITKRHWPTAIQVGGLGYLAAVLPVTLAMLAMSPFRSEGTVHPFLQLIQTEGSLLVTALLYLSAVVLAPMGEELIFRVAFQGALQRVLSPPAAIVISSLLFSAVHGFPDAVGLLPLALILGFLYWRTGSYLVVFIAHASFNAVNMTAMMLQVPE